MFLKRGLENYATIFLRSAIKIIPLSLSVMCLKTTR